jgi:hypothetical protein
VQAALSLSLLKKITSSELNDFGQTFLKENFLFEESGGQLENQTKFRFGLIAGVVETYSSLARKTKGSLTICLLQKSELAILKRKRAQQRRVA